MPDNRSVLFEQWHWLCMQHLHGNQRHMHFWHQLLPGGRKNVRRLRHSRWEVRCRLGSRQSLHSPNRLPVWQVLHWQQCKLKHHACKRSVRAIRL